MLDGYALASAEEKTDNILFGTVSPDAWAEANRRVREMASVDLVESGWVALAEPGMLNSHPVVVDRHQGERVEWVVAFGGQAFIASDDWTPIMVFGPNAVALAPLECGALAVRTSRRLDEPIGLTAERLQEHGSSTKGVRVRGSRPVGRVGLRRWQRARKRATPLPGGCARPKGL